MTGNGPLGAARRHVQLRAAAARAGAVPGADPQAHPGEVGGVTIADSRRAMMLHESGHQPVYYFPPRGRARRRAGADPIATRAAPRRATPPTTRSGRAARPCENGAWYYPDPLPGAPPIGDLIAFYFNRMDHWLEEDEEIFVHPRDPYHRIDVLATDRHIRISLDGELLAETDRALALFESNLPTRWYLPREDVRAELEPTDTVTRCPYKGDGGLLLGHGRRGRQGPRLVLPRAVRRGRPDRRPGLLLQREGRHRARRRAAGASRTRPWSHRVKSDAQNDAPALTRG